MKLIVPHLEYKYFLLQYDDWKYVFNLWKTEKKLGVFNWHFYSSIFMPRENVLSLYSRTFFLGDIFKNYINYCTFLPFLSHLSLAKVNGSLFPWDWLLHYHFKRKNLFLKFLSLLRSCAFPKPSFICLLFWLPPSHLSTASWFIWFRILELLGKQLSWAQARGIKMDTDFKDDGSAPRTATTNLLLRPGLSPPCAFSALRPPTRFSTTPLTISGLFANFGWMKFLIYLLVGDPYTILKKNVRLSKKRQKPCSVNHQEKVRLGQ